MPKVIKLKNGVYLSNSVYSTNETVVGVWINKKPIYRKVIVYTGSVPGPTNTTIAHGIQNIDMIWIDTGHSFIAHASGTTKTSYPFPINQYESYNNYDEIGIKVDSQNITFISKGGWGVGWNKYITVEYTKTTD